MYHFMILNNLIHNYSFLINHQNNLINPLLILILILLICLVELIIFMVIRSKNHKKNLVHITSINIPKKDSKSIFKSKAIKLEELNKDLAPFGFAYYPPQDIFYSIMDGWQRDCGYCQLYDEGAATFSMIIDAEPIYFNYEGKRWLIEFWKGQYGMTTGCEIGIYTTTGPNLKIPGVFNGTFYHCAAVSDFLKMGFVLRKNGKVVFYRNELHWWLTGFKLGEFSDPSELTMQIEITLKDQKMLEAFVKGLNKAGYATKDLTIIDNTVKLIYDKPHSPQAKTRTGIIEDIMQTNNRRNCAAYHLATDGYGNTLDRLGYVKNEAPKMYKKILNIGGTKDIFGNFDLIKKFLDFGSSPEPSEGEIPDDDDDSIIIGKPNDTDDDTIPETDYDDYKDNYDNSDRVTKSEFRTKEDLRNKTCDELEAEQSKEIQIQNLEFDDINHETINKLDNKDNTLIEMATNNERSDVTTKG